MRWWLLLSFAVLGCTGPQPAAVPFVPGVPSDFVQVADAIQSQYPPSFQDASGLTEEQSAANERKNVRHWAGGLQLNPGPQQIGDCVSWGAATALKTRLHIASGGRESRDVSTLYFYGITRVTVGKRKPPCRSDGAYPSFAVQGFEQCGWLYLLEGGLPAYSGSAAKRFGCDGPSPQQLQFGRKRAGGLAQPISDIKAWRNAICAGYPLTVAIPWKPGRTYVSDGKRCIAFDGRNQGGHQICSVGYDGSSGRPYWYLFNSHGENWPSKSPPLGDEPRGGVWVDEKWAQWIIDNGELWAISDVPGFTAEPLDLSIFDTIRATGDDVK